MDFWQCGHLLLCLCFVRLGGACLNGYVQHDASCYHLSHDPETWISAMFACSIDGGSLVEIETESENIFLADMLSNNSVQRAWIGGADLNIEGEWLWWKTKEPLTYTNWNPGEPNNRNGLNGHAEDCMEMQSSKVWNDFECSIMQKYICEASAEGSEIIG